MVKTKLKRARNGYVRTYANDGDCDGDGVADGGDVDGDSNGEDDADTDDGRRW